MYSIETMETNFFKSVLSEKVHCYLSLSNELFKRTKGSTCIIFTHHETEDVLNIHFLVVSKIASRVIPKEIPAKTPKKFNFYKIWNNTHESQNYPYPVSNTEWAKFRLEDPLKRRLILESLVALKLWSLVEIMKKLMHFSQYRFLGVDYTQGVTCKGYHTTFRFVKIL